MTEQIQNNVENESSNFDALAFAEQLYATIDQYRSQISANYFELITSAPTSPGGIGETKLNAFYRMIGLPAVIDPEFIQKYSANKEFKTIISQDATLNYFHSINKGSTSSDGESLDRAIFKKVRDRNDALLRPPDERRFADFMFSPLAPSSSLKDNERTSIFPLVVDAAVPVFPLSRRLAPSFQHTINGEDYIPIGSKTRLSRPLIDNILYMRLKTINNTDGLEALKSQLDELRVEAGKGKDDSRFTFIEAAIKTKLLQILKSLASKFEETRKEVQTLSTQISWVMTPVSNPKMRSAQSSKFKAEAKIYALDSEISIIKAEIAKQNAIAFMLPTEQVKRREEIRRLEHGVATSNITPDVLVSQLNNLITYETDDLNRKLQEKQHERDEKLTQVEQLKQLLMYYTGEFSGLSIFDVICVIYGLFAIELPYLLGLLNEDAQKRLKEDEFFRPTDPNEQLDANIQALFNAESETVSDSLQKLEEKVREAFEIAEAFASSPSKTQ